MCGIFYIESTIHSYFCILLAVVRILNSPALEWAEFFRILCIRRSTHVYNRYLFYDYHIRYNKIQ
jgi:hypothetical protein